MPPARLALYLASLAALIFAVRGLLVAPPPLWIALAASLAYTGLVVAGVLDLRLRIFADAVVRGPRGSRGVALTFDDGPDPESTTRTLDLLDAAGARATFFVIAKKAEKHPEIVRAIVARGHGLGLHGYEHDRLFSLRSARRVRADLERGIRVLEELSGERPVLFRPPIGHTSPVIARVSEDLDLTLVGWSTSGHDGLANADPERVASRIRRGLRDGAIVLLHDASERGDHEPIGPRVLPAVLEAVRDLQLTVVPLERFCEDA